MFGLFRRPRTRVVSQNRTVLRLESLEWRDTPDGTPGDPTPPVGPPPAPNVVPLIIGFAAEEIGNGLFLISGTVADEYPNGLTVTFGGVTSASGLTVTTTVSGAFSRTVQLRTDGTDSGFLTAITVDDHSQTSQTVQVFLDPTA
ncbi:hypothetical protein J8F10_01920 [Gemmata sp. G18]|uniref:Uncharacterized protein n=1 Tax=Gemmata palustris TaxID=2822762 RepID=A0ABS5BK25_9BACT|nr:hypothetical protein [Gemmata palustris]MBP3954055.1 hypothetical protein [Gemmata palustris]